MGGRLIYEFDLYMSKYGTCAPHRKKSNFRLNRYERTNELLPKLKHPSVAVKKVRGRFEHHSSLAMGTSEGIIAMILAMKQKINIRRFFRSVHALFSLAAILIIYLLVLTKKKCERGSPANN